MSNQLSDRLLREGSTFGSETSGLEEITKRFLSLCVLVMSAFVCR